MSIIPPLLFNAKILKAKSFFNVKNLYFNLKSEFMYFFLYEIWIFTNMNKECFSYCHRLSFTIRFNLTRTCYQYLAQRVRKCA